MEHKKRLIETFADKVWKFFSSVKLAVILLIILAIVSVIGTVIQQNEAPEVYLQEYSQATVDVLEALGFFDLYHTGWFVLLLFLLTANLTVCTLERFPHTWKIISTPLKPIGDEELKAMPFKKEITVKGDAGKAEQRAAKALTARRYRFAESRGTGAVQLMTQKGLYSRFGVYITHVSILLVFIGALIGIFFGFKGVLNLPEGTSRKVVYLRNEPLFDKIMSSLGVTESRVQWSPEGGMPFMQLGFYVQCDDFDVDYYVNQAGMPTGMPSEYHSTLSILDLSERKLFDKRIRVNDPLTYKGVTFYQSSYGTLPDAPGKAVLNIRRKDASAKPETIAIDLGKSAYVQSIDRTIKVLGFAPYGMRNPETGKVSLYHTDNDEYINPAIQIEVYKGKGNKQIYKTEILKNDPRAPSLPENYSISLERYSGTRYTGLQVTRDPGVWVVYTGFVLLCIGPLIAFFGSHRKLWVRIQDHKGKTVVMVAGTANKNRLGFEREFNAIVDELAK